MTQTAENTIATSNVLDIVANDSLQLWDLPAGSQARLINVSENATYMVEAPSGARHILRVHRENYHTERAIECELAWAKAMRVEGFVQTPAYIPGKNGSAIQTVSDPRLPAPRHMVMFEFVSGKEPNPDERANHQSRKFHIQNL